MTFTIIVSGPLARSTQAQAALEKAGLTVTSTENTHGLPALHDRDERQQTVTATGEDVDVAADAVQPFGWVLRMHHHTPPAPDTGPDPRLAGLQAQIDELKARLP